jgi:hypothetical protein
MDGGGKYLVWQRRHGVPAGTPCCNCATPLQGPWCYNCGQSSHDFHRSAWQLATEAFESFFHADGRLWRTLGRLFRNPAKLTRDFLAGKRAPQIPPLRLFLVVLLLLFLVGNPIINSGGLLHFDTPPAEAQTAVQKSQVHLGLSPQWDAAATAWLHTHLGRAMAHPDALASAMRDRAETFAFLMLPLSALILSLIFAFRRGFVLFDHLVFSMHSLSFQGLLIITVILGNMATGGRAGVLLWAAPVHLFAHMRGVYGTRVLGTLVRMAVLFTVSSVGFALLLAGLVVAGLEGLRG